METKSQHPFPAQILLRGLSASVEKSPWTLRRAGLKADQEGSWPWSFGPASWAPSQQAGSTEKPGWDSSTHVDAAQVWGCRSQQIRQEIPHLHKWPCIIFPHEKLPAPRQGFPGWDVAPPASPRVSAFHTELGPGTGPTVNSTPPSLNQKITTQNPTSDGLGIFPSGAGGGVWSGGHPWGKGVVVQRPTLPGWCRP